MSKNKDQHYVPAFYLYNFTSVAQREQTKGKMKRLTKIYHYNVVKNEFFERPIFKIATMPYLYSYKNSDGVYCDEIDQKIQFVEDEAARSIERLKVLIDIVSTGNSTCVEINHDTINDIINLMTWQIKRHPKVLEELLDMVPIDDLCRKQVALRAFESLGAVGETSFETIFKSMTLKIIVTKNCNAQFVTTDCPVVRYNKSNPDGLLNYKTEVYFPVTSRILLFFTRGNGAKEIIIENDDLFITSLNKYMHSKSVNYTFCVEMDYLKRLISGG